MKFCAVDTETEGDVPTFKSGALWSDEMSFYTESHSEFLVAMKAHARKGYKFVAHNAEYDGNVLLWNAGEDFSIHHINDIYDCGYWTWGSPRQRAQVWDTVRLSAGMSLAELGRAIGLPKYPTPKTLLGEDDWRQSWMCETHDRRECLECYNLRDAEIVWSYVNMLREWMESSLCTLHKSLPGNAVALWQQWDPGMQQTINQPWTNALARSALHGGRCEVFRYGRVGYVNTYDSRSHYGAIMASTELPDTSKLRTYSGNLQMPSLEGVDGVIDVTVWTEPQFLPPLPCKWQDRLYFPVGTFRTTVPIRELRKALPYGVTVLTCHRVAVTDKMVRPFAVTAPALLDLREDARRRGDPRELIYKFLLNSIPGRLGMKEVQTRRMYRRWRPGLKSAEVIGYDLESAGDAVFLARELNHVARSKTVNPVWASCILGEGRMRLYDNLLVAGTSAVYCDTDSVHSLTPLPTGDGTPGTWIGKGEWSTSLYLGPKLYRLEDHMGEVDARAKGVPRAFADHYLTTGQAKFQTSLSVAQAIQFGRSPGSWVEVQRSMGFGIGSRTIHDPEVLRDREGYSPTSPVVFSSDTDGSCTLTNDLITSA